MANQLRHVDPKSLIVGWDFSTGGVKCLAFDLKGNTVAEVRLPTDLYRGDPSDPAPKECELNLMQLEGQARASVRAMAAQLRRKRMLDRWVAGGVSATHHTAGRIDENHNQVRRAICWNDQTLASYRKLGEKRLATVGKAKDLIGGPWADRYSLSHLVKDEECLSADDWARTRRILPHGPLAAGYLTGNFDVISVSSAASTGVMDLRTCKWQRKMLTAIENESYRKLAARQLPKIVDQFEPVGSLKADLAMEAGIGDSPPLIFPTSDDQAAGLIGGGAVESGHVAIILGNSAVVNSSGDEPPKRGKLDVMRLNWGPYLWMRCYNNGAQFLNWAVGQNPDWKSLQVQARSISPGCGGVMAMPFVQSEPSLGVVKAQPRWLKKPNSDGERFRAALEAVAYMIGLAVREHERAGQQVTRVTVSGGMAQSGLMCEILASVLDRPLERLQSNEGPALGAAVTALSAYETQLRRAAGSDEPFTAADAVAQMVQFADSVSPNPEWVEVYRDEVEKFRSKIKS